MAGSLALIAGIPYQGSVPLAAPLYLKRPHPANSQPTRVTFMIDWATYGASPTNQQVGVLVNLVYGNNSSNKLDSIRSVYIDNSFSDVPVYVYFPDSAFVVVAPPNSVTIQPVMTSSVQALIYAEGFTEVVPLTTVIFTNAEIEPYLIDTLFVLPASLTFTYHASIVANAVTQTFNNVDLGAAALKKVNPIIVNWQCNTSSGSTLVGITVNGVAIQIAAQAQAFNAAATFGMGSAVCYMKTPAVSGLVTVKTTFSANGSALAALEVYRIVNHQDDDPVDFAAQPSTPFQNNQNLSLTLALPKGGVAIYGAGTNATGAPLTMVNSTIDFDGTVAPSYNWGSSHYGPSPIDNGARAVTNVGTSLVGAVWR